MATDQKGQNLKEITKARTTTITTASIIRNHNYSDNDRKLCPGDLLIFTNAVVKHDTFKEEFSHLHSLMRNELYTTTEALSSIEPYRFK